jgi:hypothetical protein
VLRVAADECERLAAEQSQARHDWIDQRRSALGAKRHNAAVRRLLAQGLPGAAVVGRRHLLSTAAHAEELRRTPPNKKPKIPSLGDELRAELRLIGGAR